MRAEPASRMRACSNVMLNGSIMPPPCSFTHAAILGRNLFFLRM